MKNKKNILILFVLLLGLNLFGLNSILANNNPNLIITEVANHEPSDYEWIEVYNDSTNDFIVTNLIFKEDNINHKTTIVQGSNTIKPYETFLIVNNYNKLVVKYPELINFENTILDSSWSSLSNAGELLELIQENTNLHQVIYPENNSNNSIQLNLETLEWTNNLSSTPFFIPDFTSSNQTDNQNPAEEIHYEEPETNTENQTDNENFPNQENDPENSTTNEQNNQSNENNTTNQTCQPTEIITEVLTYKNIPLVVISEFSFNDTIDWIEIYIDPRKEDFDLSNLYFEIDKKKLPLGLNYKINKPSYIIAELDLVGTTEQVSLLHNNQELDTVCWNNQNPTSQELLEEDTIRANQYWIDKCLNSQNISKGTSYSRINLTPDTNSTNDFIITKQNSKGEPYTVLQNLPPIAKIELQNSNASGFAPLSVNLDGSKSKDPENEKLSFEWEINNQKYFTANPSSIKFSQAGEYTAILTVTDPEGLQSNASLLINVVEKETTKNTSSSNSPEKNNVNLTSTLNTDYPNNPISLPYTEYDLDIYEFLANPAGSDTNKEWISIINNGKEPVNINNCTLDDAEGGSKPYQLPNYILNSKEIFTVTNDISKIALNNTNEQVRLFCNGELVSMAEYANMKEDEIETNYTDNRIADEQDKEVITTNLKPLSTKKTYLTDLPEMNMSLAISEIFPNPKGTDSGNEWIEIHNPTNQDTKLAGWTIQINSKNHSLDKFTAKSKSYTLIKDITIPNSNTTIKLINPHQNTQSELKYEKSFENQSYNLIDEEYQWLKIVSPEKPNPTPIDISGIIEKIDQNSQEITIKLDEFNLNPNSIITITADKEQLLKLKASQYIDARIYNYENQNILSEIRTLQEVATTNNKNHLNIKKIIIIFSITIILLTTGIIYREKIKQTLLELMQYLQ